MKYRLTAFGFKLHNFPAVCSLYEGLQKTEVLSMSAAGGYNVTKYGATEQGKVTDKIKNFVANEFISKA